MQVRLLLRSMPLDAMAGCSVMGILGRAVLELCTHILLSQEPFSLLDDMQKGSTVYHDIRGDLGG